MPYKDGGSTKTSSNNKGVAGKSVYAPLGALSTESTTDVSGFVARDQELGIPVPKGKNIGNEVRKA